MQTGDEIADVTIIDDGGYALWGRYKEKIVFIDAREVSAVTPISEDRIPKVGETVRMIVRPIPSDVDVADFVTKDGAYEVTYSGSMALLEADGST